MRRWVAYALTLAACTVLLYVYVAYTSGVLVRKSIESGSPRLVSAAVSLSPTKCYKVAIQLSHDGDYVTAYTAVYGMHQYFRLVNEEGKRDILARLSLLCSNHKDESIRNRANEVLLDIAPRKACRTLYEVERGALIGTIETCRSILGEPSGSENLARQPLEELLQLAEQLQSQVRERMAGQ